MGWTILELKEVRQKYSLLLNRYSWLVIDEHFYRSPSSDGGVLSLSLCADLRHLPDNITIKYSPRLL